MISAAHLIFSRSSANFTTFSKSSAERITTVMTRPNELRLALRYSFLTFSLKSLASMSCLPVNTVYANDGKNKFVGGPDIWVGQYNRFHKLKFLRFNNLTIKFTKDFCSQGFTFSEALTKCPPTKKIPVNK